MFDVGFTEIMLIGIVSLIVIGPERLPAVARTVGLWVGKLQRFVRGVKTDLASELETGDLKKLIGDQRQQINELRTMVDSARKDLQSTSREVVKSAKSGLADLERTVNDAKEELTETADAGASDPNREISASSAEHSDAPQNSTDDIASAEPPRRTGTTGTDGPG